MNQERLKYVGKDNHESLTVTKENAIIFDFHLILIEINGIFHKGSHFVEKIIKKFTSRNSFVLYSIVCKN